MWLIKATQRGAVALCHWVLLLCVASASWEQKYSFSEEQGIPLVAMRRFSPFLLVRVSRMTSRVYSPHISGKVMLFIPEPTCVFDIGGEQVLAAAAATTPSFGAKGNSHFTSSSRNKGKLCG